MLKLRALGYSCKLQQELQGTAKSMSCSYSNEVQAPSISYEQQLSNSWRGEQQVEWKAVGNAVS
jgi:hypothetical protein